jgi:hypothetical protein
MPYTQRPAAQRAAAELRKDPCRSDLSVAQAARTSNQTVRRVRALLVSLYQIGDVPQDKRQHQPMPRLPSRTRAAIQALGPGATARQVAALAGVNRQSAWRALKVNPQAADLAAAVDSIQVLRVIPRRCAQCRTPFTPDRLNRLYCTPDCKAAAEREQARRSHARQASPDPFPAIPDFPPAPDWSRGLCTTVKASQRTWWTSEIRTEREAAQLMCQGCPVREPCAAWSLSLPLDDAAIYGGMSQAERIRRRSALRAEIIRQVTAGIRR